MWPPSWDMIAEKGEKNFQYMLGHNLAPYDDHLDHFCIYHGHPELIPYFDEFQEAYRADVERLMIPWIREEERSGRLKDRAQWRPFRDNLYQEYAIMGYRHLFVYQPTRLPTPDLNARASFGPEEVPGPDGQIPKLLRVYFMLSIVSGCRNYDGECNICENHLIKGCTPNYVAALYGWEEDDIPFLKPHAHFQDYQLAGLEVPLVYWNRPGED